MEAIDLDHKIFIMEQNHKLKDVQDEGKRVKKIKQNIKASIKESEKIVNSNIGKKKITK